MACRNGLTKSLHSKSIPKAFGAVMVGAREGGLRPGHPSAGTSVSAASQFVPSPGDTPSASGEGVVDAVDVFVLEGTPAGAFAPSLRGAGKRADKTAPEVPGRGGGSRRGEESFRWVVKG